MFNVKSISITLAAIFVIFSASMAYAEVKVFEREVEDVVGRNQSQEQVESFLLQKAKRLAVEEAGTYISTLSVVKDSALQKDEVTALASGVVQAKIVGVPEVRVENGNTYVKVRARIEVDTSTLDSQIKELLKETGTLKKLEEERRRNKELEDQIANLKGAETKRLEELNAQALAIEREREKQRLFLEEQALKAQGALKQAEIDRIQKEKELQAKTSSLLAEQERKRREEAEAIAKEQDRIKKAQLENEQRWNELTRKSQMAQSAWVSVDDQLSLKQAIEEAKQLKAEIAKIIQRVDQQNIQNHNNLEKAYEQQIALSSPSLPPAPGPRDPFETTEKYDQRVIEYNEQIKKLQLSNRVIVEKLTAEKNYELAKADTGGLTRKKDILSPYVARLQDIQKRTFLIPGRTINVTLGDPEPEQNRFPITIQSEGNTWNTYWNYSDVNNAKDFYKTRSNIHAEALYQIEDGKNVAARLVAVRVTHLGTGESRDLSIADPEIFLEVKNYVATEMDLLAKEKDKSLNEFILRMKQIEIKRGDTSEKVPFTEEKNIAAFKKIGTEYKSPSTEIEFVFIPAGCYEMGCFHDKCRSNEYPLHTICITKPFYMMKYMVTTRKWLEIVRPSWWSGNPQKAASGAKLCSWNDVQSFINAVNRAEGVRKKYRLPTEAEWEYAARCGGLREHLVGTNDYAAVSEELKKNPNGLGLNDMLKGYHEWCSDWYDPDYYSHSPKEDPNGPEYGKNKVLRKVTTTFFGDPTTTTRDPMPVNHEVGACFRLVFSFDDYDYDTIDNKIEKNLKKRKKDSQ
jgi:formylglycine-generating enzyme required for sulfatase activity